MQEWFTIKELTEAQLPGLPKGRRGIKAKADREGWGERLNCAGALLSRRRIGLRGGGNEYHFSLFPDPTQRHLLRNKQLSEPTETARSACWDTFETLTEKQKQTARDRLLVIEKVETLVRHGLQKNIAVSTIAAEQKVSGRSIYNWFGLVDGKPQGDWLPLLAPRHAGRRTSKPCDPQAWEFIKADYLRLSEPRFRDCFRRLELAAREHGWTIPSEKTLSRRMEQEVPLPVRVLLRKGQEALKRMYPPQERDRSCFHAMEAVNIDGHKWDVFVKWPDGSIGRPLMVAIQDLYSGKIVSWRVDKSENADLVRLACRDMFEQYGIPDQITLDNGKAFASKLITGGATNRFRFKVKPEEPTGILTAFGINLLWTQPYSGQSKPIERAFRELCQAVAKHPAFEGAYTGNKVDAKPENYGSKAVDLATFVDIAGQGIIMHNQIQGRRAPVCAGIHSFNDVFQRSMATAMVRRASEEQLRMCLLAAENVHANKEDGSIRLDGNRYWSELLVGLRGTKLTVRFDPDALHAGVDVYRLDGVFVGRAECLEAVGFNDKTAAREHARDRKAFIKANKEAARLHRKLSLDELSRLIPRIEDEDPPASPAVRLVHVAKNAAALAAVEDRVPEEQPEEEDLMERLSAGLRLVTE